MNLTIAKFVKFWLMVSFSKEMWGSLYFCLFYFLIVTSNLQDKELTLEKVGKQALLMVVIALTFGLIGTVAGLVKYFDHKRVEKETAERMAYARRSLQDIEDDVLLRTPIGPTTDAEVTDFIKVNIRLK